MFSKQTILSAVWLLSHLSAATFWETGIPLDYKSFSALETDAEHFFGPDGLYTWTNTSDLVYLDATTGGNFSIEYPAEYQDLIDRATKLNHPGLTFLPGAKASRSADMTCGQICGASSPGGGAAGYTCVACTCSLYSQVCEGQWACESVYGCQ